ncbi:MAG TPA: acetate kinase [Spirochaetia bacterium]|nr:acetate kinase [Spirochaetia bacterium]
MIILTLNCGSSSAKYQVYDWDNKEVLCSGVVERVTFPGSFIKHIPKGKEEFKKNHDCPTHTEAIQLIIDTILDPEHGVISDVKMIKAVGHRVLHGGDRFTKSVIIDAQALKTFREVQDLGPLHNPANIMGIEAAQRVLPDVPHCAIMDTAWHQTMPKHTYIYALPYEWYEKYQVRRYGFHGTSHLYVAKRASVLLGKKPQDTNLIICHIGNGASICAVKDGKCYDTSMGLTPLEGLVMGTRSGDIDPAIINYINKKTGLTIAEIDTILNKKSGLLGITGRFNDRRDVRDAAANGDERCKLAIDIEAYRLKKYIGSYTAALGRVDALIFTAGVGEFAPHIREHAAEGLDILGIKMDMEKNALSHTRNAETDLTAEGSHTKIFVIPTDEELVMTEDTYALLQGTYDVHTNFTYSFQSKDYVNKERAEGLKKELQNDPRLEKIIARVPH